MNVLLSIKPDYVEKILDGSKKYEFRKIIFRDNIKRIMIYSSSPVKKIVGFFSHGKIIEDTPENLWKKCKKESGISEKAFFEYFNGNIKGYAIKIETLNMLDEPIEPQSILENFCPPQSFYYLDDNHPLLAEL